MNVILGWLLEFIGWIETLKTIININIPTDKTLD